MNLKKILTVAAVSVAAAAFALLIVIFAMPKPEDKPQQLNDGTAFFEKYPTLESLLSSEKLEDKRSKFKKLIPPYQGFNFVSFQWDENAKIRCVCLHEENPPELSADDEKKRMKAYAEDFFWHWRISKRDPRYVFRFIEAEDKYDIRSGKMVRKGAMIFIHVIQENGEEMHSDFYQSH